MESEVDPSQKVPSFRTAPPWLTRSLKASTVCTLESKHCRSCVNCFPDHLFPAPRKHRRSTRVVLSFTQTREGVRTTGRLLLHGAFRGKTPSWIRTVRLGLDALDSQAARACSKSSYRASASRADRMEGRASPRDQTAMWQKARALSPLRYPSSLDFPKKAISLSVSSTKLFPARKPVKNRFDPVPHISMASLSIPG